MPWADAGNMEVRVLVLAHETTLLETLKHQPCGAAFDLPAAGRGGVP